MRTISIRVTGKVQGVYFRQSVKEHATELGIRGTVRNNPDGSVTIVATASDTALKALQSWCKKGPVLAKVEAVHTEASDYREFDDFSIVR